MNEEASAPQTIGRNIARLRRTKGWSQAELGKRLAPLLQEVGQPAWSRQAVNMAEKGRRSWIATEIAAAAKLLGTTPGALFEDAGCATCGGNPPAGFVCKECEATG